MPHTSLNLYRGTRKARQKLHKHTRIFQFLPQTPECLDADYIRTAILQCRNVFWNSSFRHTILPWLSFLAYPTPWSSPSSPPFSALLLPSLPLRVPPALLPSKWDTKMSLALLPQPGSSILLAFPPTSTRRHSTLTASLSSRYVAFIECPTQVPACSGTHHFFSPARPRLPALRSRIHRPWGLPFPWWNRPWPCIRRCPTRCCRHWRHPCSWMGPDVLFHRCRRLLWFPRKLRLWQARPWCRGGREACSFRAPARTSCYACHLGTAPPRLPKLGFAWIRRPWQPHHWPSILVQLNTS